MSVYATLEWVDRGAVFQLLSQNIVGIGNAVSNLYAIDLDSGLFKYHVALKSDFSDQISSRFESASSRVGAGEKVTNLITTMGSAFGTLSGLAVYFDLLTWEKTEPYRFNIEVEFKTKTNSFLDVLVPMKSIQSLHVLTDNGNGTFSTPGINFANVGDAVRQAQLTTSSISTRENVDNLASKLLPLGKFMKIHIPGRVHLDIVLVENVQAEYSSEITDDQSPLWGKLDISCVSLFPANDKMLAAPLQDIINQKNANDVRAADDKTFAQIIKKRTPVGDIISVFK